MLSHWFSYNISPSEFFAAVESRDLHTVRQYLYQYRFNLPAINVVNQEGETALILACKLGRVSILKALLNAPGIDVNARGAEGDTALMHAASRGYIGAVEVLLDVEGVNVNARDVNGSTALMAADDEGCMEVVDRLLLVPDIDTYGWDISNLGAEDHPAPLIGIVNPIHSSARRTLNFQERLDAINYTGVVPAVHCCPISLCIMDKPIVVSSGQVYDLESLQSLFQDNQDQTKLCAVTRLIIRREELQNVPCSTIKDAIENFVVEQERLAVIPIVEAPVVNLRSR